MPRPQRAPQRFTEWCKNLVLRLCLSYFHAMGTFHIACRVTNSANRKRSTVIPKLLVDTGSEYTWVAESTLERLGIEREKKDLAFVMANGTHITRSVGFAILQVGDAFTIDEVVFAEKGDLLLLGARTLEGLNLVMDSRRKKLVGVCDKFVGRQASTIHALTRAATRSWRKHSSRGREAVALG